jgi:hypothetical protein
MRAVLLLTSKLDSSQKAGSTIVSPDKSGMLSGVGDAAVVAVGASVAVSVDGAEVELET